MEILLFSEDKYEAKKEMTKVTPDALFDYWQGDGIGRFCTDSVSLELLGW